MNLKLGSPLLSFSYNERPERTVIGLTNRLSIHKNQRPGKLLTVVAPIKTVMYNYVFLCVYGERNNTNMLLMCIFQVCGELLFETVIFERLISSV